MPQTKVCNIFKYITALLLTTFTLPIIHLSYPPPSPPLPAPLQKRSLHTTYCLQSLLGISGPKGR